MAKYLFWQNYSLDQNSTEEHLIAPIAVQSDTKDVIDYLDIVVVDSKNLPVSPFFDELKFKAVRELPVPDFFK